MKVLGQNIDKSFIVDQDAKTRLKMFEQQMKGAHKCGRMNTVLKNSSQAVQRLLTSMLEFNPYSRGSAGELLQNKIFDSIRSEKFERDAPYKIQLEIDECPPSQDELNNSRLQGSYQKMIIEVASYYKGISKKEINSSYKF